MKMTSKQLLDRHDEIKDRISKKYGFFLYFLLQNIFNISKLEELVESKGFSVKRKKVGYDILSEIYDGEKHIGLIQSTAGWPTIELLKFKGNKKIARSLAESDIIIEPVEGYHRILDWHDVCGKLHILAGGQIILNSLTDELKDQHVSKFINDNNLTSLIGK